ncbi:MAG: hypothetical protein JO172_14525 [Hyphomicrobiales bacterium]|nr:hypothetical protein [Hyphomicrobiales bacterium]
MMSWFFALLGLGTAAAGGGAIAMGWPLVPLERGWTLVIAGSALASGGLVCLAIAALMGETRRTRRMIERALEELAWSRPIERMSATTLPPAPENPMPRPIEREYVPPVPPPPHFGMGAPPLPPMPSMPAAAPLGVAEPRPEASPVGSRQEPRHEPKQEPRQEPNLGTQTAPAPAVSSRVDAQAAASPSAPAVSEKEARSASEPEDLQPARSFSVGTTTFVVFTDGTIEARTPKGARRFDSMEEVRSYLEESAAS